MPSNVGRCDARCLRLHARCACATYEARHLRSVSGVKSEFMKYLSQNSRIPGPASDRCPSASASNGPCLFACSTSLPALFRAVSTWYSHKRDQVNSSAVDGVGVLLGRQNMFMFQTDGDPQHSSTTPSRFVFPFVMKQARQEPST